MFCRRTCDRFVLCWSFGQFMASLCYSVFGSFLFRPDGRNAWILGSCMRADIWREQILQVSTIMRGRNKFKMALSARQKAYCLLFVRHMKRYFLPRFRVCRTEPH